MALKADAKPTKRNQVTGSKPLKLVYTGHKYPRVVPFLHRLKMNGTSPLLPASVVLTCGDVLLPLRIS